MGDSLVERGFPYNSKWPDVHLAECPFLASTMMKVRIATISSDPARNHPTCFNRRRKRAETTRVQWQEEEMLQISLAVSTAALCRGNTTGLSPEIEDSGTEHWCVHLCKHVVVRVSTRMIVSAWFVSVWVGAVVINSNVANRSVCICAYHIIFILFPVGVSLWTYGVLPECVRQESPLTRRTIAS